MPNCNNDDLICGSDLCDISCEDGGFTLFGTGNLLPIPPPPHPLPLRRPRSKAAFPFTLPATQP